MPIRPGTIGRAALALAALAGAGSVQAGDQPQRLFLQQVAPHSAIVKWRGGDATRVCFSTKLSDLEKRNWPRCVDGIEEDIPDYDNHRQALLTGRTWVLIAPVIATIVVVVGFYLVSIGLSTYLDPRTRLARLNVKG